MVEIINNDMYQNTTPNSSKIKGVVWHNDYGAMSAKQYIGWLQRERNPHTSAKNIGFAHYYIDRNTIVRVQNTAQMAYANSGYNDGWISFETCQSRTASDADFRANEEMVLRQMAEDLQFYGLPANLDTCKLHMQFGNTSCPHRTKAIHGSYAAAQGYMVERIKHYMSLGKTVKEMIANENKPKKPTKTTKFKVGDRVKLRGDKATHWAYVYTDLVKNGGEKLSERDIDKGLQGKTFVITWLADNQICELALLKPDGSLGQFRYAAYDWDLNKV